MVLRAQTLARWERWALIALIAFSAATHTATLAVLLALLAAGLLVALVRRGLVPFTGLARGAFAIVISIALLLAANYAVAGRLAWTPGGSAIPFGRMLQAGIVARYLAERCPDPRLPKLCANRDKLPTDADFFFWGSDLFDELGRFEGLGDEMRIVVRESLTAYPGAQLGAAIKATAEQLVRVATGYGVRTDIWHTHWIIETFAPHATAAMKAAHQQRGDLGFTAINRLHVPVAWGSMLLLVAVLALAARRREFAGARRTGRRRRARDPRQRRRLRRALQSERPLRRAHGLAGDAGGAAAPVDAPERGGARRRAIRPESSNRRLFTASRREESIAAASPIPPESNIFRTLGPLIPPFAPDFRPIVATERDFRVTRLGQLHPVHQFAAI